MPVLILALPAVCGTPAEAQLRTDILSLSNAPQPPPNAAGLPYANPNAPKGGHFTTAVTGSFDNLNPFILRGTAPPSIFHLWQPLFKPSDTDSVTAYAELGDSAVIGAGGHSVTFHLNPAARFSDGSKVTSADVAWTYRILTTEGAPFYAELYSGVAGVATPDTQTVTFTLAPAAGRALILDLAEMYILPAHFWAGRNFADPLLQFPIGSGAYQVQSVDFGNAITYRHVRDWWAESLPADRGFDNFDILSEQYVRADATALQAFRAGQIDARIERNQTLWPAAYNDAGGQVALEQAPLSLPAGINGFVMNTRRGLFADVRVRRALTLAFDFESIDRVLLHNAFRREHSYFTNSPMASTPAFALPVTDGSGHNLPQLIQAMALLRDAGWRIENFRLVRAGLPFAFEILVTDPQSERIAIAYAAALDHLGIQAMVHQEDPGIAEGRLETFDFDMTFQSIPETDFPGNEQAGYWGCAAAHAGPSENLAGICAPEIDSLIAAAIAAPDIATKTIAIRALDQKLLNGWYIIPFGAEASENLAYWQARVAKPEAPLQLGVDFDLWWAK